MMTEFLNRVYNKFYYINLIFKSKFSFVIMVGLRLRGIKIQNCKFYGRIKFIRKPDSVIFIGRNCQFRNSDISNLIGVNHKCIISTHSRSAKLIIGDGCGFSGTTIGCFEKISIGNNVKCGSNTLITDSNWHPDDFRSGQPKPIVIEDNVWLGYGVVVLKGVTIGKNSLIGINSVVTSDIPQNCIAAGSPCKIIRYLK